MLFGEPNYIERTNEISILILEYSKKKTSIDTCGIK